MPEIFKTWDQDPEFQALPSESKRGIYLNYFDAELADDEFNGLDHQEQERVRTNFLSEYDTPVIPEQPAPETFGQAVAVEPEIGTRPMWGGSTVFPSEQQQLPEVVGAANIIQPEPDDVNLWEDVVKPTPARAMAQGVRGVAGGLEFVGDIAHSDTLTNEGKRLRAQAQLVDEQIRTEHPAAEGPLGEATSGALTSIYLQAPFMAAGILAKTVQAASNIALAGLGAVTGGDTYGERRAKGFDVLDSSLSAAFDAVVEVGTEKLPFDNMMSMLKPGARVGFNKMVGKVGKLYGAEMAGESIATALQDINAKFMSDPNLTTAERHEKVSEYFSSGEAYDNWVSTIQQTGIQTTLMGGAGLGASKLRETGAPEKVEPTPEIAPETTADPKQYATEQLDKLIQGDQTQEEVVTTLTELRDSITNDTEAPWVSKETLQELKKQADERIQEYTGVTEEAKPPQQKAPFVPEEKVVKPEAKKEVTPETPAIPEAEAKEFEIKSLIERQMAVAPKPEIPEPSAAVKKERAILERKKRETGKPSTPEEAAQSFVEARPTEAQVKATEEVARKAERELKKQDIEAAVIEQEAAQAEADIEQRGPEWREQEIKVKAELKAKQAAAKLKADKNRRIVSTSENKYNRISEIPKKKRTPAERKFVKAYEKRQADIAAFEAEYKKEAELPQAQAEAIKADKETKEDTNRAPEQEVNRLLTVEESGAKADKEIADFQDKGTGYPLADRGDFYGEANYKAAGAELETMTPNDFLEKAKELDIDEETRENIDDLKTHIREGKTLDPLTLYGLDKTKVRDSDGRHRAIASKELGVEQVPVIVFPEAQVVPPKPKQAVTDIIPPEGKVNGVTRNKMGQMIADGDETALEDIRQGIEENGLKTMEDTVRNEIMRQVAKAPKGEARDKVRANIAKLQDRIDEALKPSEKATTPPTPQQKVSPAEEPAQDTQIPSGAPSGVTPTTYPDKPTGTPEGALKDETGFDWKTGITAEDGRAYIIEDLAKSVYKAGLTLKEFAVKLKMKLGKSFDQIKDKVKELYGRAKGVIAKPVTGGEVGAIGDKPTKKKPEIKDKVKIPKTEEQLAADKVVADLLRPVKSKKVKSYIRKHKKAYEDLKNKLMDDRVDIVSKQKLVREAMDKLPVEVRGKTVNEINKIALFKTPKGRLAQATRAFNRLDRELEQHRKRELKKEILKTIKKSRPKGKQEVTKGKNLPDVHASLERIHDVTRLTNTQVKERLEEIMPEESDAYPTDEQMEEITVINMYGAMGQKTSAELEVTLNELTTMIETGKTSWKQILEDTKAANKEKREEAVADIQGSKEPLTASQRRVAEAKAGNFANKFRDSIREFSDKSQAWWSLQDKLSRFSKSSKMATRFTRLVNGAQRAEDTGVKKTTERITSKLEGIYGVKGRKLSKKINDNTKLVEKESGINLYADGVVIEKDIPISPNQAYKKWMEWQDESLQDRMIAQGITEDTIDEIEAFMTPEIREWAEWQLDTFYQEYYDGVNDIFRQLFYTDMPHGEKYSPVRADYGKGKENDDLTRNTTMMSSIVKSSLKNRVGSNRALLFVDGDAILTQHVAEMEHFKAWALPLREMRSVFSNEKVRTAIKDFHGKSADTVVQAFVNDFASRGVDQAHYVWWMDKLRSAFTQMKLGGNLVVFLKQLSSIPAYAMDIPVKDFMAGVSVAMANPGRAARELSQSEMLQTRYGKGMERDVAHVMKRSVPSKLAGGIEPSQVLMALTQLGDKGAIILGGYSVYRYHLNKNIKSGMTEAEAKKEAIIEFESSTERSQQASNIKDLAHFQRGGSAQKMLTMFMTSLASYMRIWESGWRNLAAGRGSRRENLKKIFITHVVLPIAFQLIASGGEWDEDKMKRAIVMGPLSGLFFFRDVIGTALDEIFLKRSYDYTAAPPLTEVVDTGADIARGQFSLKSMERMVAATRVPRGIYDLATGETKDVRRALGYSESALDAVGTQYTVQNNKYNKMKKEGKEPPMAKKHKSMASKAKSAAKKSSNPTTRATFKKRAIKYKKQFIEVMESQ